MRTAKVSVTAFLSCFFLLVMNASAGPLISSGGAVSEALAQIKLLIIQASTIQQELNALRDIPAILAHLNKFEDDLGNLEIKINGLREIGKIRWTDATFIIGKVNICDRLVTPIVEALINNHLESPSIKKFSGCRTVLRVIKNRLCKHCRRPISPILSEQNLNNAPLTQYFSHNDSLALNPWVELRLSNGVYLLIRAHADGRREVQKFLLLR